MTTHAPSFTEYFTFEAGTTALRVDRLDDVVRLGLSVDGSAEGAFVSPATARAAADALRRAARDAEAAFRANEPTAGTPEWVGLEAWSSAFVYGGLPLAMCPAGDGRVQPGHSARVETITRRVWHDDCAEDEAARLNEPLPTPASAPPESRSAVAIFGGAHGAAGADRASAVPCRPAAPSTSRR